MLNKTSNSFLRLNLIALHLEVRSKRSLDSPGKGGCGSCPLVTYDSLLCYSPPWVKRATTSDTQWQQEVVAVRAGNDAPPSLPAGPPP